MILNEDTSLYYNEFIEFITSAPSLESMANFRLSPEAETRIAALLDINRNDTLTTEEQSELDEYIRLEHIMRLMKYRAYEKLESK